MEVLTNRMRDVWGEGGGGGWPPPGPTPMSSTAELSPICCLPTTFSSKEGAGSGSLDK